MKKMYNVVQGQPRYNDPTKSDWIQLGVAWDDSKGMRIKFNALPLPNKEGDVWVSLYPKDDKDKPDSQPDQAESQDNSEPKDLEDEIPF